MVLLTDQTTIIKLKTVSESNRNLTWIEQKNSFKMRMHNNRSSSLNIPVTAAAAAAFLTTSMMMMMMMMMMLLVLMLSSSSSSSSSSIFVSGAVVEYNMALVQRLGQKPIVEGIDSGLSPDCSDIWAERRWLFLAANYSSNDTDGTEDCGDNYDYSNFANECIDTPTLPGPLIEAQEGDTIRITITNKNEIMATTVHWHGLHQRGTVWNDGTSQITQCSLSPFESQTYEFIAYPAGTHYWHSHQGMTATDGIAGPIVIHPKVPEPFYEELNLSVDDVEEQMLFLMDYFDDTSLQREAGLASESLNWIGNPASLLLNGKGLSKYCTNFTGQQPFSKCLTDCLADYEVVTEDDTVFGVNKNGLEICNDQCIGTLSSSHICLDSCSDTLQWTPSILVEQGKTYRFRVVNGGGLVMQNLAINQHNMTIVEVDGTNVVPYTVQNLTIAPGQRYSVIVYADQGENDDDGEENFWMQSLVAGRPLSNMPEGNWVLSYANSTANVQLPNVNQKKPTHPVYDVDQTQVFTAFFENLHTTGEEEVDNITTTTRTTHESERTALSANESDVTRYHLTLTQGWSTTKSGPYGDRVSCAGGGGGTCQVVWTLNNISFVYPDSGSPLIYSAVEESQRLGWPLPGPLTGTVDMPRKLDTNWNVFTNFSSGSIESVAGDSVPGDDDDTTPPGYYIQQQATSVIRLNEGDVAEFVIENSVGIEGTSEFHPWHFHGHSFWVVGRGIGTYNETQDVPNYNLVNPVLRDTTVGLKNSWVAIRFIANNPGVWYLHCHIESHLTMGMGFVVIVSPNKIGSLTDSVQYCSANDLQSPFQSNIVNSSMDDTTTIAAADESEAASAGNNNDAGYNAAAGIIATTMAAVVIVTSMMSYL